jgi:hypothetical protein
VVGTVYSVVLDVAAAVRDSALDVTAIVYCILSVRCMHPLRSLPQRIVCLLLPKME